MTSKNLEEIRLELDKIDHEMAILFESRLNLVAKVREIKMAESLPILDAKREEKVIAQNLAYIHDPKHIELYKEFIIKVMEISRSLQEEKK